MQRREEEERERGGADASSGWCFGEAGGGVHVKIDRDIDLRGNNNKFLSFYTLNHIKGTVTRARAHTHTYEVCVFVCVLCKHFCVSPKTNKLICHQLEDKRTRVT